ncbi:hypothetical protein COUCH_11595 [Couchioplanes caeruleus]|uniref:hypothetical protein n=1 Tax=Couchioplanes caeruleus TaxID=56438 RepID=UPI0020BFC37E|nr:hypothetical protein [Couchioplanes caeruleus]UQU66865.1 hypothetical protein COUCH_11595 [Couchioplanes caeruleus]
MLAYATVACAERDAGRDLPRWESCHQANPWSGPRQPGTDVEADLLPRLDVEFAAAAAVVCSAEVQKRPDGSQWEVATEDKAGDITALVAALHLPDVPRRQGFCQLDNPGVPWFVLLDASGRWVRPGIPLDDCGKYRHEVRTALAALTLTRTASWPIQQTLSAQAAGARCGQRAGNPVQTYARVGGWAESVRPLVDDGALLRLCVYRVPVDQRGTDEPVGDFQYGGSVAANRSAAIDAAVRDAPRADPDCAEPVSRFAVLYARGKEAVFVELDGCRRVSINTVNAAPSLQQGTAALMALLNDPKDH